MNLSGEVVLLITHSGDFFTVDRVAENLVKLGAQPFRLDTDKFPGVVRLDLHVGNGGGSRIIYGENSIRTEQVRSVWMRRIWSPELSKDLVPRFQAACVRESLATLEGLWDGLREAWWVDNLQRIGAAENKLRQLRVAQEIGLRIPRTLVTNNGEEVREFFRVVGGRMVAKLLTPLSQSMQGSGFFLYTNAVKEEDLSDVGSLCYSPMVFQEQIPKLRELRVVFVNGKLFVGALDASLYADSTADWRQLHDLNLLWQSHELPAEIAHRLQIFMASFGLIFGAFDLIQTPSGEYVFLEVNPTGEWGMLERDLGYPISEAIARALLGV
ncbi:MvdC family ATP-grasp ribosomal peptide maturase [Calothrix sp. NIES-3974]|uniref:MvdC family ATP-grasp ribosomal peptide maturase n=1 Tax=Calothrix sp. NIES-3974 TaxID=2005462 RepID=UPI000B5E8AF6|nr:MvdC family ATP-grasp ribosomal peptide maturase [Calothrix sp. NIES-3974]BAZ05417.1 RimK domain-containing protein ATP-grasp [Calothrix sp. NIES-3974]